MHPELYSITGVRPKTKCGHILSVAKPHLHASCHDDKSMSHYWTALEMKHYYHRTCPTLVTHPYSVPVYSLTIVMAIPVAYHFSLV